MMLCSVVTAEYKLKGPALPMYGKLVLNDLSIPRFPTALVRRTGFAKVAVR